MQPERECESRFYGKIDLREPAKKSPLARQSLGSSPENALTETEKEFQEMIISIMDLQRQLEQAWELNGILQGEIKAVRASKEETEVLANSRAQKVGSVQGKMSSLRNENRRLMAELSALEDEQCEAAREINGLRRDVEGKRKVIHFITEKVSNLENSFERIKQGTKSREQSLQEKIQQLEQNLEEVKKRLKQRTHELHRANVLVDDLTQEKQRLESEVISLEQSRTSLGKMHDVLKNIQDRGPKRQNKTSV